MSDQSLIHPVVLSGGVGTRLWPLSREAFPKQFLSLAEDESLLQATVARTRAARFAAPLLVCSDVHRFLVAEQMRAAGIVPLDIILEPFARNTAAAVALAALRLAAVDPAGVMLVMPSDHVIADPRAFSAALDTALPAARDGALVTFGVTPTRAETGYGYIERGRGHPAAPGAFAVARFTEKPDRAQAADFVATGRYFWNSGIFLFTVQAYLAELERLAPDVLVACRNAVHGARRDLDFTRINAEAFEGCPEISIDYAVMEPTDRAAMVPVDMGWSDVGAWNALWDLARKDGRGNAVQGDVILNDVTRAYVRADHGLVAVIGLSDVVVVATDDAVLVADRDRVQDVKQVVARLQADGRQEHMTQSTVYRPWGSYRQVDHGDRFQVKQLMVKPGAKLSLQMHHHRAEHWIVVQGTAKVTCDDKIFLLEENQSTYIPLGARHRLENPGKVPLRMIEVQSGRYLGEDDIVRFEDTYGRR